MISIWQTDIAERAFLWLSGVTPAQQSAFTEILTSGKSDLIKKAFDITHISVHKPIISIWNGSFILHNSSASFGQPKPFFSKIPQLPATLKTSEFISQPLVFFIQWGTGRFLPSWVSK